MRTEGSPHAEAAWRGIAQQNVQLRARIAQLEGALEELERERDEACEQVMQHQVSGDYEMGQYYHKELAMMPIINLRARLQRQRQQAVIEAAQVMVETTGNASTGPLGQS